MLIAEDAKRLLNQRVVLTTVKNSKYTGILNGVREDKLHLTKMVVCQKNGAYKGVSGNSNYNKRWFNLASLKQIELDTGQYDLKLI